MIDRLSEPSSIYLTFDDGPHPEFTPRLLDLLDLFEVKASFFVVGADCQRHPELLRRILASGHALGNHTLNHHHPWFITDETARREVHDAAQIIADVSGEWPRWFRPPFGRRRRAMLEQARALGMETTLWDRSAIDWGMLASVEGISTRLGKVQPGEILLCHDAPRIKNRPDLTLAVLPAFIEDCHQRQLHFATLHEGRAQHRVINPFAAGCTVSEAHEYVPIAPARRP